MTTTTGRFEKGRSGNPRGRPPGIANQKRLREAIAEDVPGILEALVERARGGDVAASKLLLDRTLAPLRPIEESVTLPLGDNLAESGRAILAAIGTGKVAPDQGARLLAALGSLVRVIEVAELEARVTKLETERGLANDNNAA